MHKNLNGFLVNTLGLAKRSLMSTAISSDAVMPLFAALCLGFASLIASGTDLAAATFGKAYNKRIATVPIGWPVFDLFAFSDDSTVSMYTRKDPRDYQLGVSTKLRFTDTGGLSLMYLMIRPRTYIQRCIGGADLLIPGTGSSSFMT